MALKTQLKKYPALLVILLGLLAGLVIALIAFLSRTIAQKNQQTQPGTIPDATDAQKFFFFVWGVVPNITLAKLMVAIAAHETGSFKSTIYLNNHNAFGMRLPKTRSTLAVGEKDGHAYFNTIEDSIRDWLMWWNYHNLDPNQYKNVTEIVTAMKNLSYFEASLNSYRRAVQAHFNNLSPKIDEYMDLIKNNTPLYSGKIEPL